MMGSPRDAPCTLTGSMWMIDMGSIRQVSSKSSVAVYIRLCVSNSEFFTLYFYSMAMYCGLSFAVVTVHELSGGPVHDFLMVITLSHVQSLSCLSWVCRLVHAFTTAGTTPTQYVHFSSFADLGVVGRRYIMKGVFQCIISTLMHALCVHCNV